MKRDPKEPRWEATALVRQDLTNTVNQSRAVRWKEVARQVLEHVGAVPSELRGRVG